MRMLITGPPGAGKGTQASGIASRFDVPAISSGDLFRAHIKAQDELGSLVSSIISRGEFVPDEVTTQMIFERLDEPDAKNGWLLDGFPRTLGQVDALTARLDAEGVHLGAVLVLLADPEALVERMLKRAELQGRADDNAETIRTRLKVYGDSTRPVLDVYRARGLVVEVDALGTIDEVAQRINEALNAKLAR